MTPRPLLHLKAAGDLYPAAWERIDEFRQSRGVDLPRWPAWCFLPLAAFYAIVSGGGSNRVPLNQIGDVARLGAIGTWRYTQGIYRFDSELYESLRDTPLDREMPVEVLYRLPEWCVYIETPSAGEQYGFFAHLEWDANTERPELRFLLDTESALQPMILHIGDWTVEEGLTRMIAEAEAQSQSEFGSLAKARAVDEMRGLAQHCISLLLYLCSDEPDVERVKGDLPQRPQATRTKKGWRMFPPSGPRVWKIGQAVGERLRQARGDMQSSGKREPHIRRAHWHGYWTGPRDSDDRKFIYKWLPPIFVGAPEDDGEKEKGA